MLGVSWICALCAPSSVALWWSQPRFFVSIGCMARSRTKTAKSCSNFFVQSAQGIITSTRNTESNSRLYLVGYACSWLVHSLLNTVCRLHLGTKVSTDSVRIDVEDASKASSSQSTWRRNYNLANKWTPIEADEVEPTNQIKHGIPTILLWKHKLSTWSGWKVPAWCSRTQMSKTLFSNLFGLVGAAQNPQKCFDRRQKQGEGES